MPARNKNAAQSSQKKRNKGSKRGRRGQQSSQSPRSPQQQSPSRAHRPSAPSTASIAAEILKHHHFAKDAGGRLYVLQEGVYVPQGEETLRVEVKRIYNQRGQIDSWTNHKSTEVAKFIGTDAPRLWDKPAADVVNLKNGLLHVPTRALSLHDPKHLSPIQIPVVFDPEATCPEWDKFVGQVFPADATELAWEIVGYLLTPDTSIQKAFLFIGGGGNGKSTFLAGLRAFLGDKNVCTATLQDLVSNRFVPAQLYGKLANISPDLPSRALQDTGMFKAITGGDAIQAERKFGQPFSFVPFARLLFPANQFPRGNDSTTAFADRWVVVPLPNSFRGTNE